MGLGVPNVYSHTELPRPGSFLDILEAKYNYGQVQLYYKCSTVTHYLGMYISDPL